MSGLKAIFSSHGIPEKIITDNGPQYACKDFQDFSRDYCFTHITSNPRYAQSNGESEGAVQSVKQLFEKLSEPYLALLAYRSTPLEQGYSPAQLLMSGNLQTNVSALPCHLKPVVVDYARLQSRDLELKQLQKDNYDLGHRVHDLPPLEIGDPVYIPQMKTNATVQQECGERSLIVSTPKGQVRYNQRNLNALPTASKAVSNIPQSSLTPRP